MKSFICLSVICFVCVSTYGQSLPSTQTEGIHSKIFGPEVQLMKPEKIQEGGSVIFDSPELKLYPGNEKTENDSTKNKNTKSNTRGFYFASPEVQVIDLLNKEPEK